MSANAKPAPTPSTALPILYRTLTFAVAAIAPLVLATVAWALVARGPTAFGVRDLVLAVLGLVSVASFAAEAVRVRRGGRLLADGGLFPGSFPPWLAVLAGLGACVYTTVDAVAMGRALNAGGVAGSPFELLAGFFIAVASSFSGAYGTQRVRLLERAAVLNGTPVPWTKIVRYGWTGDGRLRLEVRDANPWRREPVWAGPFPVSPAARARFDEVLARHARQADPPSR